MPAVILFSLREVVGKTVWLCLLSTFLTHVLLILSPVVRDPSRARFVAAGAPADAAEERLKRYLQSDVHAYWMASSEDGLQEHRIRAVWQNLLAHDLAEAARYDPSIAVPESRIGQEQFGFYFSWLRGLARGDFGYGAGGQQVWAELKSRLPTTFFVAIVSLVVTVGLAAYAAAVYALCRRSKLVRIQDFLLYAISTVPAFITGYCCLRLFGVNVTPSLGLLLPTLTLVMSNGLLAELLANFKSGIDRVSTLNYVVFARSKGLSEWEILRRHVLRNALVRLLPQVSQKMAFIVSGTIVVEKVFNLNGLADMLVDGLAGHDNGRVLVVVLLATVLVRLGCLMADTLLYVLDPKHAVHVDSR